jgi:hypothetical protein
MTATDPTAVSTGVDAGGGVSPMFGQIVSPSLFAVHAWRIFFFF